jgi:hypothetical protein
MTKVLYRISRGVCPAPDRQWVDALFAEAAAVEPGISRFFWLLGAFGLMTQRYARQAIAMVSPAWLVSLVLAVGFVVLAFVEYEGLAIEDDWYPALAALFAAVLLALSVLNLKRDTSESWP